MKKDNMNGPRIEPWGTLEERKAGQRRNCWRRPYFFTSKVTPQPGENRWWKAKRTELLGRYNRINGVKNFQKVRMDSVYVTCKLSCYFFTLRYPKLQGRQSLTSFSRILDVKD